MILWTQLLDSHLQLDSGSLALGPSVKLQKIMLLNCYEILNLERPEQLECVKSSFE